MKKKKGNKWLNCRSAYQKAGNWFKSTLNVLPAETRFMAIVWFFTRSTGDVHFNIRKILPGLHNEVKERGPESGLAVRASLTFFPFKEPIRFSDRFDRCFNTQPESREKFWEWVFYERDQARVENFFIIKFQISFSWECSQSTAAMQNLASLLTDCPRIASTLLL
jgi:hypothetical protein